MTTPSGGRSPFEIDDELRVLYKYGYGGITPFFAGLAEGAEGYQTSVCDSCELAYCPPRIHCQECWGTTKWVAHSGEGVIESLVWAYWIPIDSPARAFTDLPYAYAAIRLDGCRNLLRTRVSGLPQGMPLPDATGVRGRLRTIDNPTGRLGDLYFEVDPSRLGGQ
ncbi:Zn-ribbon domain-containing OB-fold protein [Mycolicibacterium goodii]|uniref:DNA-binding protein n=1 Tax=Mycolicibacterium goodii TaxID=134601 RepID=A0A0K0X453_MYCGD|nr:hypothetical protein AFA91_09695 [Mycolicibacterium goodii]